MWNVFLHISQHNILIITINLFPDLRLQWTRQHSPRKLSTGWPKRQTQHYHQWRMLCRRLMTSTWEHSSTQTSLAGNLSKLDDISRLLRTLRKVGWFVDSVCNKAFDGFSFTQYEKHAYIQLSVSVVRRSHSFGWKNSTN